MSLQVIYCYLSALTPWKCSRTWWGQMTKDQTLGKDWKMVRRGPFNITSAEAKLLLMSFLGLRSFSFWQTSLSLCSQIHAGFFEQPKLNIYISQWTSSVLIEITINNSINFSCKHYGSKWASFLLFLVNPKLYKFLLQLPLWATMTTEDLSIWRRPDAPSQSYESNKIRPKGQMIREGNIKK